MQCSTQRSMTLNTHQQSITRQPCCSLQVLGSRRCLSISNSLQLLPRSTQPRSSQHNYQQQQLQRCVVAAAAPAVIPAVCATASFPALQGAVAPVLPYVMAAAAACCAVLVVLMVVAPGSAVTQRSVRSNLPLVLLAVAYGAVLLASWSTDTLHLMMPGSLEEGLKGGFNPQFFPTLESVEALFRRPFTAASFLLHVLAINLIAARSAYVDGLASRVPTAHSVLLSSVVGPLGLLSHQLTKWAYALIAAVTGRDLRPAAKPKLEKSGPGTITIMPYDK